MKTTTVAVFLAAALATIGEATVPTNFAQLMLTAVNSERAKVSLPPLCINSKLQKAVQLHAEDQAANNLMSHTESTGETMSSHLAAQQSQWNEITETVAVGQADVAAVMDSWRNSPDHMETILGDYKFFGTGYAFNPKGDHKHYWTQSFGASSSETCDETTQDDDSTLKPTVTSAVPTPAPSTAQAKPKPTPAPTTVKPSTSLTTIKPTPAPMPTPAATTTAPTTLKPTSAPTTTRPTTSPTTVTPTGTPKPTPSPTTVTPIATPKPTPTVSPSSSPTTSGSTIQQRMLAAVNAERALAGKVPLCANTKLQKAAQLHSEDQATNNFMDHKGSNGSTIASRIAAQQFDWTSVGENVAAGQVDVAAVVASWMKSPGHKANILGDYKFFGMGFAMNAQGTYKHYWTQDFAKGATEVCEA